MTRTPNVKYTIQQLRELLNTVHAYMRLHDNNVWRSKLPNTEKYDRMHRHRKMTHD